MSRERQGQPPTHEERLPWDQQDHLRQGNRGYRVHPVGGEEVSELRHVGIRPALGLRRGHLHARQGVQAGQQVRVHLGLLAFLLPQQGQGDLEYQWGPGEGREEGAACGEGLSWYQLQNRPEAGCPAPGAPIPPWTSPKGLLGDSRALPWRRCLLCCQERQVHPEWEERKMSGKWGCSAGLGLHASQTRATGASSWDGAEEREQYLRCYPWDQGGRWDPGVQRGLGHLGSQEHQRYQERPAGGRTS